MENYLQHQRFPDGISTKEKREILEEPARTSALQRTTDIQR